MDFNETLSHAITQFNAGEFFDCHETLEPLWQAASGDERIFLHSLIQAAVALCHAQRGNRKGALSVHLRAQSKFKNLPDQMHGVSLRQLSRELEAFFGAVYAAHGEAVSFPTIQWQPDSKLGD